MAEPTERPDHPTDAAEPHATKVGKRHRCPECGSRDVGKYMFGMPSQESMESPDFDSGEVAVGGCVITPEAPEYRCWTCGHCWGFYLGERERARLEHYRDPEP